MGRNGDSEVDHALLIFAPTSDVAGGTRLAKITGYVIYRGHIRDVDNALLISATTRVPVQTG